jgi:hypothetical protein
MSKKGKGRREPAKGKTSPPARKVYRDASAAWEAFKAIGGLDLADRDADIEMELLIRINQPHAQTLDEALRFATTDDLVRALFTTITPFIEMFRDTLEFFKKAGARSGRQQWEISIDDQHLDLKDFERLLSTVSEVKGRLEVPDFDPAIAFDLYRVLPELPAEGGLFAAIPTGDPETDRWIADYRAGAFPALPASLRSKKLPPGLDDLRRVLMARLAILRAAFGDRKTLNARFDWTLSVPDAYHPMTVAEYDRDFWAGSTFAGLHRAAQLSEAEIAPVDVELQRLLSGPRRFLEYTASVEQLERLLSLPVWGKRHELYAVWIATVIVGALPDHEIELHQEDGRIVFAFKETEVARVMTSFPERRLIAERRTPLANPLGKGRKGAVQPDFGIWVETKNGDACQLVVEVKHYKREKARAFKDVLTDYANAHPTAQVALVNHGPLGWLTHEITDRRLADRCHTIGNLTAHNSGARASLAKLVKTAVGSPVPRRGVQGSASFLIDVSGSMDRLLNAEILSVAVDCAARAGAATATLVDVAISGSVDVRSVSMLDVMKYGGGGTSLASAATELIRSTGLLIALTDAEGFEQLRQAGFHIDVVGRFGMAILAEARAAEPPSNAR